MKKIIKLLFIDHPKSVGETFLEHFFFAFSFGLKMLAASLIMIIHAIFPCIFKKTGSRILISQMQKLINRSPSLDPSFEALGETIQKKTESNSTT